jgi:cellulose synthase/poly-beta-1,6-N-acetylglucosamine synthase-like glycosyltransferase
MYYFLWIVSFVGLILGVFWLNILFFDEGKRIKLKSLPYVSVIIPSYNEEKTIERTIKSLLKLNYPRNKLEIIVVNDESTDNTINIVKKFKQIELINNKHKGTGKASAVNAGLKVAKGEFFGVLDADSEVGKNSLRNALTYFSDRKVGAVITPIKIMSNKNLYNWLQKIEYAFTAMIRELMSRINTLYYSHGVLSLFRKDLIKKLGGFDENNLTEDLEIAMRLKSKGYEVRMASNSITYTRAPSTFGQLWKQRVRWYRGFMNNLMKYKYVLFRKKYGAYGNFQLPLNIFSLIVLVIVFFLFLYELTRQIYNLVMKIILLKSDIFIINDLPSIKDLILLFDVKYYFPIFIVILINLFLFYRAHKILKEKTRFFRLSLLLYFIVYPLLTMLHWMTALFQELFSIRKKW